MPARLQLNLLGPAQISLDGAPLRFAYNQVRTLLIYLALEADQPHGRDTLAALLWPDHAPEAARTSLRQALAQLRSALGDRAAQVPFLQTGRETIQLNQDAPVALDVASFDELLRQVDRHHHGELAACTACIAALEQAALLYRGDLLEQTPLDGGFELEEWVVLRREALHRPALDALTHLANAYERRGAAADACRIARRILSLDRWREEAHRQVMRALYQLGDRAAALAQFAQCRRTLRDELDIDPADETVAVAEAIRTGRLELQLSADRPVVMAAVDQRVNPYKGLRAFNEPDAADFFGREALVEQLLAQLRAPPAQGRFLAVVGPSGSGKSSLVRAGLFPALRRNGLPGVDQVRFAAVVPGPQPLKELATTLGRLGARPAAELQAILAADSQGLVRAANLVLPPRAELVLLIDQFEEVFTLTGQAAQREQVCAIICHAVSAAASRVRVIITLRADFYDRPLLHPGLGELLRRHTALVLPLSADELLRAIVRPAQQAGITFAEDLTAAIVHDVSARPGMLPLLQYALTELFERRAGQQLSLDAYRASGGVTGALNQRAEALYTGLDAAGRQAARQLLLRLIALDEGADDLRRRVPLAEFGMAHADDVRQPVLRHVMSRYGRYRLLTFDRDPEHGVPTVELAHEALIRDWARLRDWCAESRAMLRTQRRLLAAAHEWAAAGGEASFLATGARLAQFEALAESNELWLSDDERAYLEASLRERERLQRLEDERRGRELAAARENVARLRGLTDALLIFATLAQRQQQIAEANAQLAQGQALASAAQAAVAEGNLDQARALALAAVGVPRPAPDAEAILAQAAYAPGTRLLLAGHSAAVMSATFDQRGGRVLSGGSDLTLRVWDSLSGAEIGRLAGLQANPWSVALSRDGRFALAGAANAYVHLWEVATGAELRRFVAHDDEVTAVAFSPDGRSFLSASRDTTLRLWGRDDGRKQQEYRGHSDWVWCAAFSPDGRQILSGSSDTLLRLWETSSGRQIQILSGHSNRVQTVACSPDGRLAVSGSWDETMRLWDLDSGQTLRVFGGHAGSVMSVAFSPDSRRVASAAANLVRVWDVAGGAELCRFPEHRDEVFTLAFSPDGRSLLSGSRDGTLRVWDLHNGAELRAIQAHKGWVRSVALHPAGRLALSGSYDWTARLWDVTTGQQLRELAGHGNGISCVALSPDGQQALTGSVDRVVRLWDVASGRLLREFAGHAGYVWDVAFAPAGRLALSAAHDGTLRLWDLERGSELTRLSGHSGDVGCATFSPDGLTIISGGADATLRVWDHQRGRELRRFVGHTGPVSSVAVSSDGRLLLSGSADGTARLWDLAEGRDLGRFPKQAGPVHAVAFDPAGEHALFATGLATLALWDVASGRELRRYEVGGAQIYSAVFSADGRTILAGTTDGSLRLWRVDTLAELLDFVAARRHIPELTAAQRTRYYL